MPRVNDDAQQATGAFKRQCPHCGEWFMTDDERVVYCSLTCKQAAANKRYYEKHAKKIRATNNARQKKQRARLAQLEKQP